MDERCRLLNLRKGRHLEAGECKYPFSGMITCFYCGHHFKRRKVEIPKWMCRNKDSDRTEHVCKHSMFIIEPMLEKAFVDSYNKLCNRDSKAIDAFIAILRKVLKRDETASRQERTSVARQIHAVQRKINDLIDEKLNGDIGKAAYESRYKALRGELDELINSGEKIRGRKQKVISAEKRLYKFKEVLQTNPVLKKFDGRIFRQVVRGVIIGGYDDREEDNPEKITFIFKTGHESSLDMKDYIKKLKEQANKSEASSLALGEKGLICSSVNSKPSNKYSQHGVNMSLTRGTL